MQGSQQQQQQQPQQPPQQQALPQGIPGMPPPPQLLQSQHMPFPQQPQQPPQQQHQQQMHPNAAYMTQQQIQQQLQQFHQLQQQQQMAAAGMLPRGSPSPQQQFIPPSSVRGPISQPPRPGPMAQQPQPQMTPQKLAPQKIAPAGGFPAGYPMTPSVRPPFASPSGFATPAPKQYQQAPAQRTTAMVRSGSNAGLIPVPVPPAKKRKPLERSLPRKIEEFVPEAKIYAKLQEAEKNLDATMLRKKMELHESMTATLKTKRTLRILVSNTAMDQLDTNSSGEFSLESLKIPSWTLKVEGRLMDATDEERSNFKFSQFLKSIAVSIDRDPNLFAESNEVEWRRSPGSKSFDAFEVRRNGDADTPVKITISFDNDAERLQLSPPLAQVLGFQTNTRANVIMAIWQYVKLNGLQNAEDKRLVNLDAKLSRLFQGKSKILFSQVPDLLRDHLFASQPLKINYTVSVSTPFTPSKVAYEVPVELEDPIKSTIENSSIEDIHHAKLKRDFMLAYAKDPVNFINKWIASQSRDLEMILGNSRVNLEEMRRSDFYKKPWVEEAVFHYLQGKVR
ncbi:hypothetical protein DFJ73DRAFT_830809 [Zopfochytrium polystomum]|nr:hypothetical protein DFJ73DRAFT_830809 [Zopfochytrium polystomum]